MRVQVVDVYGEPLPVPADIRCERLGSASSDQHVAKDVPPGAHAEFETAVVEHYRVRANANGYGNAGVSVPGTETEVRVVVPMSASLVAGFEWPSPLPKIPGVRWGQLGNIERAALLNIWAKAWDTTLGVSPIAGYIDTVVEVRVDRIIVELSHGVAELLDNPEVREQNNLDLVPSALHEPPTGYTHGPSVKSRDDHGNIQVTTFLPDDTSRPVLADIDIDENRKTFAHLFDVLMHTITGDETDQVEVHAILVTAGVDPGWRPLLA